MIEGLFAIVTAIIEAIISIVAAIIELVAGLFITGGEALSASEILIVIGALILEVLLWGVLWLVEFIKALVGWRKPKKVKKH
jgi:hypothetical protein